MLVYDSHCHLEALTDNIKVFKIAIPAITFGDSQKLFDYKKKNHLAKIGCGLHPWHINKSLTLKQIYQTLTEHIQIYKPDFIGETGLDFNKPYPDLQQEILIAHLQISCEFNLPIILHCVRAYNELLSILTKFPKAKGIIHAYDGNREMARQFKKKNMFLGIGSIILNSDSQLAKSIAHIPSDQLLLESDAPFMPMKGRVRSSSQDCLFYAEELAKLKNKNLTDVINEANQNWDILFSSCS